MNQHAALPPNDVWDSWPVEWYGRCVPSRRRFRLRSLFIYEVSADNWQLQFLFRSSALCNWTEYFSSEYHSNPNANPFFGEHPVPAHCHSWQAAIFCQRAASLSRPSSPLFLFLHPRRRTDVGAEFDIRTSEGRRHFLVAAAVYVMMPPLSDPLQVSML